MERGGAEADEGNPLTVEFSHVAQRLAGQNPIVQVMLFLEQPVKLGPLVLVEQPDADALQEIGFVSNVSENHAATFSKACSEVIS